jgi:hypothetical protein
MTVCETDPAWWSIVVSYCMVFGFTVGIAVRDDLPLDTISTLVAREPLTLHGFAMVTVAMVACQIYWVRSQVQRWGKLHKGELVGQPKGVATLEADPRLDPRIPTTDGWSQHPVASTCIALGSVCSVVGSLGYGIVSTNLEPEQHERFAGVAFGGVFLYLVGFAYLGFTVRWTKKRAVQSYWTLGTGTALLVLSAICLYQLAKGDEYWWEYILVSALHGGALALTVPLEHRIFYTWV